MSRFSFLVFLQKGDKSFFDISPAEQLAYLDKLGMPRNDLDRSFKQYLCQYYFLNPVKRVLFNLAAILIIPFFIIHTVISNCFNTKKISTKDAIGEFKNLEEIIPDELNKEFVIDNDVWYSGKRLSIFDLRFILKLFFKYFYAPVFVMKSIMKISKYSFMIKHYNPKAIIVHNEYSYTSSLLTLYCNANKVDHINVMHGEKLLNIRDAYFHYNRCYIWHKHYKELFLKLKAEPTQFIISIPRLLRIECEMYYKDDFFADYKYYLTDITKEEIESIINSMSFAKKNGVSVKYRPHPRYTDVSLLEKVVNKKDIEYPNEVSIMASVASSTYAVGSYTTVLTQAYLSGKQIVLDDVTYFDTFKKLDAYDYILSSVNYLRLSQLQ